MLQNPRMASKNGDIQLASLHDHGNPVRVLAQVRHLFRLSFPARSFSLVADAFNLTRQPAATIPCGHDREGLPIGLQIVSGHARDALVLRAAAAYERVRPIPAPPMAHKI